MIFMTSNLGRIENIRSSVVPRPAQLFAGVHEPHR